MTQHALQHIRLQLARSKDFPSGSARRGYDLVAPLDAHGHIDPELWHRHRKECRVRRFWDDEEAIGLLVHKPGGAEHARWMFDYGVAANEEEEAGYGSARTRLRPENMYRSAITAANSIPSR
jgi:hypothetical protein